LASYSNNKIRHVRPLRQFSTCMFYILNAFSPRLWSRLGLIICFLVLDVELAEGSIARILIFSRTVEFRHDSIPTAIEALKSHSSTIDVVFDQTEDQSLFTDDNLQKYDGLVFLSNTGEGPYMHAF